MKILTYNLWHGLTPSSAVSMEALEPEARRRLRLLMQLKTLKSLDFDLGLFQEVNPLLERAAQIESELDVTGNFQSDLVGIKVLGLGLPNNLNSGLLTVAKNRFQMRRVGGLKLSGTGRSFVSPWLSFQLQEERYALFSEFMHTEWGRVLVVNTHLHHGLELTSELENELKERAEELGLTSSVQAEISERLQKGNQRRLREVKRLLEEVARIESRYSLVIIGGDFNERSDGELGQLLKEYGFQDSFGLQTEVDQAFTYDRAYNSANHMLQSHFPLSVKFEDLSFSKKVTLALKEMLERHEASARRIDQIWIKAQGKSFKARVELVGQEDEAGFAPSDHFGYLLTLS